jgi:glutathione S-transferase
VRAEVAMIALYTSPTPNGWKASIALEELALPYHVIPIDRDQNETKRLYPVLDPGSARPSTSRATH